MKKATYHKPQMEVIELTTSHMLSASIYINNNKVSTGGRAQDKKENSLEKLVSLIEKVT